MNVQTTLFPSKKTKKGDTEALKVVIGDKHAGDMIQNTYKKKVWKSKHLYRKTNSWGIDAKFLTSVLVPRNSKIEIYDMEEQLWYESDAQTYYKEGKWFHFKSKGEDYGAQVFLNINKFKISK